MSSQVARARVSRKRAQAGGRHRRRGMTFARNRPVAAARLEGTCETRPGTDPLRSALEPGPVAQTYARPDLLRSGARAGDRPARSSNGGNRCLDDFAGAAVG